MREGFESPLAPLIATIELAILNNLLQGTSGATPLSAPEQRVMRPKSTYGTDNGRTD